MTDLAARGVRAILLDIEGTTTPIAFVHEELFPYARKHLPEFLDRHGDRPDVRRALALLETDRVSDIDRLMAADSKSAGLKKLQGLIWEDGYRSGALRGQVFEDVAPAMRRWSAAGYRLAIYSSGSELAQRLLFGSTKHGDLTPLITAFFDTAVGAKQSASSYAEVARMLDLPPAQLVFISDVAEELSAAHTAGYQVLLSVRPGNQPQPDAERFETITSFESLR